MSHTHSFPFFILCLANVLRSTTRGHCTQHVQAEELSKGIVHAVLADPNTAAKAAELLHELSSREDVRDSLMRLGNDVSTGQNSKRMKTEWRQSELGEGGGREGGGKE